jgi:hypothetical protein
LSEEHSAALVQVCPLFFLPTQAEPVQKAVAVQHSPSAVQLVRQVPSVSHACGQQDELACAVQLPSPLHNGAGVYVDPVHESLPQVYVLDQYLQAPAPLHSPSWSHESLAVSAHSFFGSCPSLVFPQAPAPSQTWQRPHSVGTGSVLLGTKVHVPNDPDWLHIRHVPLHALSQHTPSTQKPDVHSLAPMQARPSAFLFSHVPSAPQ